MKFYKKTTIAALFSIPTFSIPAYATVINFYDIGFPNTVFPNYTYAGFTDQGFVFSYNEIVIDISSSGPWSNEGPAFSGRYAALNDYIENTTITMVGGGTFYFNSIYIKGWDRFNSGVLEGYSNGSLVGSINFSVSRNTWSQFTANFSNVDSVVINSGGALLLDDVTVNGSVPLFPSRKATPCCWPALA